MQLSMTGYGKAKITFQNKDIIAEIRSLNSRNMDISVKMPASYKEKEIELRSYLSEKIGRGKAECTLRTDSAQAENAAEINEAAVTQYYNQLSKLMDTLGHEEEKGQIFQIIMRMPEILKTSETELSEEEWAAVMQAVDAALVQFNSFRAQEGKSGMKDILDRVQLIKTNLDAVQTHEKNRIQNIRERIDKNLSEIAERVDINTDRFEQEIIYYLEKLDITEERVRLSNHCLYFTQTANKEPNAGKKLNFIAQEIGREINTIGSKANDTEIQKLAVQMKDELEKIKEQLMNVL